jgi:spermidine synthase
MATVLPAGAAVGRAVIRHCAPTKEDAAFAGVMAFKAGGRGVVRAGDTYAQLIVGDTLWMSDTPDERRDHWRPVQHATGHTLVAGLGLGMVALAVALKPAVTKVTVIEINRDVIELVAPYLRTALRAAGRPEDTLDVIEADVFKWKPEKGTRFDAVWLDIWATLCTEDLAEHGKLSRKFARYQEPGAFREAWGHGWLKRVQRHDREERRHAFRGLRGWRV